MFCLIYLFGGNLEQYMSNPQAPDNSIKEELRRLGSFLVRALSALSRLGIAWVFVEAGRFVEQAVVSGFTNDGNGGAQAKALVAGITNVYLVLLLAYLAWDALAVFMPFLKGKKGK